jgi:WXXGXW repeat (2 copies)
MRRLISVRNMLLGLVVSLVPTVSFAQVSVGISVHIGPPALPVYTQPICPSEGYIWTPGYWAYGDDGYYWVPGVWVMPPRVGVLWTPGYWGWSEGVYAFHGGYWGPHVGFYGGVNYGFGYGGVGFGGGEWRGGHFAYNTAVTNVNTTVIHNTYVNKTVIVNNTTVNRTSFNGGPGGIAARPTSAEMAASHESHIQATRTQVSHQNFARADKSNLASVNHGKPATPAMSKVNAREANQQARIAKGEKPGQLTHGEARNLEKREGNINKEVRNDRKANGGKLTPAEHKDVNRQQNNTSRAISNDKHNASGDRPASKAAKPQSGERPHP